MVDYIFVKINKIVPQRWKWVLEHAGLKRYTKNTGWMFFGQFFSLLISFFIGAWLARYLGPESYGTMSYVVAFVGMFNFIANLGIYNILLRDLAKHPEKRDELLGTSFAILMLGGITAFALVVISVFIFEPSAFIRGLIILYATTFLWSALGIVNVFFQSTVQAKKNVGVGLISGVVISILKISIIFFKGGIVLLMLVFVFETLLSTFLFVAAYKKSGFKFSTWKFDRGLAREILSGAWLLTLAGAASYIFLRVDQVMIKKFLGEASVGLYAVSLKLVEIWYFIPGIICTSLYPAIINAKKVSEERYLNRLRKLYILLAGMALVIAIPLSLLAPWIIVLLFGKAYAGAVGILRIYVWSGLGYFLNVGFYHYFLSENRLKFIFYFYLVLMIVNILLNIILIPKLGLPGAAWATLISYSIGPFIVFGYKKLNNLK